MRKLILSAGLALLLMGCAGATSLNCEDVYDAPAPPRDAAADIARCRAGDGEACGRESDRVAEQRARRGPPGRRCDLI